MNGKPGRDFNILWNKTMSMKKYIYKDTKNDEDNDFSSPCFQVSTNIQLKEIPTNGEEYLLKVIQERKNISTITKCDKDYSIFAKNQSCFVEELPHAAAPEQFKPTIEWQNIQVADFSDVRMYISRLLAKKSTWPNNVKKVEISQNSMVGWKDFFAKREPTLSCVLGLNHTLLDDGLKALTTIIAKTKPGETINHKTGQWIYAFLACTRQPLLSDTTSILRNLARKCAEIRSRINPDDEHARTAVGPLNIFICLVGRYFRQYDLAD